MNLHHIDSKSVYKTAYYQDYYLVLHPQSSAWDRLVKFRWIVYEVIN